MLSSIPEFTYGQEARRDPFAPGAGEGVFLHLTGRGQTSYLIAAEQEPGLNAALDAIPMGYTQIWVIEWAGAAGPAEGTLPAPVRRAAGRLCQDRPRQGESWVLIGERGGCLGWCRDRITALEAARAVSDEKKVRIAVGLLRLDITWH